MQTVTYSEGDLEITAPASWSGLKRANAVCELQHGHPVTEWLAVLALLHFGTALIAAPALIAGWSPGMAW